MSRGCQTFPFSRVKFSFSGSSQVLESPWAGTFRYPLSVELTEYVTSLINSRAFNFDIFFLDIVVVRSDI